MKRRHARAALVAAVLLAPAADAQVRYSDALVPPAPTANEILPRAHFDAGAARDALARGHSTIRGIACAYKSRLNRVNPPFPASNRAVHLFPASAHLAEWVQLRKRKRAHDEVVLMAPEAFDARVEGRTDGDGRFEFTEMKPGRYYLYLPFDFSESVVRNEYVGSARASDGSSAAFFRPGVASIAHSEVLERIVEIKRDGDVVDISLTKGWGGILSKITPCH